MIYQWRKTVPKNENQGNKTHHPVMKVELMAADTKNNGINPC